MTDKTPARAAIVTGGAGGIGAAIVKRFARDGLPVAIFDLDEQGGAALAAEVNAAGGRALALSVDITDDAAVAEAVAQVASDLAPPLITVNNAGITRDDLLFRMTMADWRLVLDVHLTGAFVVSQATQRYMVEAKWGRFVNLSSTSALGNRGQLNYSTAKAGVQGFTKTLAVELGPFGVTANAIAPGFIATEMTAKTAERLGIPFEEFKDQTAKNIPVRRVGTPADIANLAAFLVSEESGFISGQVIYAAGGPKA